MPGYSEKLRNGNIYRLKRERPAPRHEGLDVSSYVTGNNALILVAWLLGF